MVPMYIANAVFAGKHTLAASGCLHGTEIAAKEWIGKRHTSEYCIDH